MTARQEAGKILAPFTHTDKMIEAVAEALEARNKIIAGCVLQLDSLTDLPTTQRINVKVFLQYLKDKGYA